MSNRFVTDSRPLGDWSDLRFREEASAFHQRYATYFGAISPKTLEAVAKMHSGFLYHNGLALNDGYVPLVTTILEVAQGKVALVFPKFSIYVDEDGNTTERSFAIHTMRTVRRSEVVTMLRFFWDCMPDPPAPPNCRWPHELEELLPLAA